MTTLSFYAQQHGIRHFLVSYTDLLGVQRAKLVPTTAIDRIATAGAGFAGFATWFAMTPADPDVLAMADASAIYQLPWQPEVAWIAADPTMAGSPVEQAPRRVLQQQLARAKAAGIVVKTGVECEFFITTPDGLAVSDPRDTQGKPCYDQQALMRRFDLIAAISDAMLALGWGPYQSDHEDANGQFEMNWTYDHALVTADRHSFFKFLVKSLAERHGLRATFMPKPFARMSGNGCHIHVSLWDSSGTQNLFVDPAGELGLSQTAYHAIGGLMHHAQGLCAITNPTVNSYKRINGQMTSSGATWSPNSISYTGNNRTHMIRIPEGDRFEFRLPDGAANPYLLQAAVIAAALDGVANHRDPGPRYDNNMYTHPLPPGTVKSLPSNLLDALRTLRGATELSALLGNEFVAAYLSLKDHEWRAYSGEISPWELANTLDC